MAKSTPPPPIPTAKKTTAEELATWRQNLQSLGEATKRLAQRNAEFAHYLRERGVQV